MAQTGGTRHGASARAQTGLSVLVLMLATSQASWTPVRQLSGFSANRLMRSPSVAMLGDTIVVAADGIPLSAGDTLDARLAVLVRDPGGRLEPPHGLFQFVAPKVVVDSRRRIHLFWGEFDHPAVRIPQLLREPSSLWHSVLADGAWTTPQLVIRAKTINWGDPRGALAADASGAIHLVVPAAPNGGADHLVYLQLANGHWARHDFSNFATGASVLAIEPRTVLIAFVGNDSSQAVASAAVLAIQSHDDGATWRSAELVDSATNQDLGDPRVLRDGSAMDLVWARRARGEFAISSLGIARRALSGGGWSVPREIEVPPGTQTFDVARAACADVVAVVETLNQTRRRLVLQAVSLSAEGDVGTEFPTDLTMSRDGALTPIGGRLALVLSGFVGRSASPVVVVTNRVGCRSRTGGPH